MKKYLRSPITSESLLGQVRDRESLAEARTSEALSSEARRLRLDQ
jgi:hypothetical protein